MDRNKKIRRVKFWKDILKGVLILITFAVVFLAVLDILTWS